MGTWYYAIDRQQSGPVEREELEALARSGQLKPTDLVWNPELGEQWVVGSTLPWLQFLRHAPPPISAGGVTAPARAANPEYAATGGVTANAELTRRARETLRGRWGGAIGIMLLNFVLLFAAGQIPLASLFVAGPFSLGVTLYFLTLRRRQEEPRIGQLFDGFKQFGVSVLAQVLMSLFILLWSLLLIIPGIIAAYSYMMTFYVLADNPGIGASEAIRRSKAMMDGNKWKFFCLQWRFFGWALLCVLTFGIGFIWLMPYMQAACTEFYEDLGRP